LKELIALATLKKLTDATRGQVQKLLNRLPLNDPTYARYEDLLTKHKKKIEDLLLSGRGDEAYQPFEIGKALNEMLIDKGSQGAVKDKEKDKEKQNVSLVEFWSRREMQALRVDIEDFRRRALYGDPLLLTRKYGKGNVVSFLTTAGTTWSGWSGGTL